MRAPNARGMSSAPQRRGQHSRPGITGHPVFFTALTTGHEETQIFDKRVSSFSERAFDRHTPLQGPADLYHAECAHGIA
jgi:hypothetical protein